MSLSHKIHLWCLIELYHEAIPSLEAQTVAERNLASFIHLSSLAVAEQTAGVAWRREESGCQLALDKTWEMPQNVIFRDGDSPADRWHDIWHLASDWSKVITWTGHWFLIGHDMTRWQLISDLWLVESDTVTWILDSDWSMVMKWQLTSELWLVESDHVSLTLSSWHDNLELWHQPL